MSNEPNNQRAADLLREAIHDAIAATLGDAYDCTRVWSAWSYGTMGQDDFSLITDDSDRMAELTDAVLSVIASQPAAAQEAVAHVVSPHVPENMTAGQAAGLLSVIQLLQAMPPVGTKLYAAPVAASPVEMSPEFTDTARAAIAWVLWHHLGGSSPVGQPLRFALGMGDHDPMPDWRIAEAKRYAELAGATTADFHKGRASTPAAPGIDRELLRDLIDYAESGKVAEPSMVDRMRACLDASPKGGDAVDHAGAAIVPAGARIAAFEAEVAGLRNGIERAMGEIDDDGPKALKYARQELKAALQATSVEVGE